MLRKLLFVAGGLFVLIIVLLIAGLSTNAAGLLGVAVLCLSPLFFIALGAIFGRGSIEYQLVPKTRIAQAPSAPRTRFNGRAETEVEVLG
jgi:hypothetical protein